MSKYLPAVRRLLLQVPPLSRIRIWVPDGARTRDLRGQTPPTPVSRRCLQLQHRLKEAHFLADDGLIKERQAGVPGVIWATSQELSNRSPRSER